MTGWLEGALATIAPGWALRRARARATLSRLYEAARPHHQHRRPLQGGLSGDSVIDAARGNLRDWARHLDENYDLATHALDMLVDAVCGRTGIVWEPQLRDRRGELLTAANRELRELWAEFWARPDVTRELAGEELERLVARTAFRDGEALVHHLEGRVAGLTHASAAPYSLQLLEPDFLPWDLTDTSRQADGSRVVHGVQKTAWGEPLAYLLHRQHPGDSLRLATLNPSDLVRVPAERITHVKIVKRLNQTRGVTALHAVIYRLDDLADLDRSERLKVRVASAMCAAITKSPEIDLEPETIDAGARARLSEMQSGIIFDLLPGEDVRTIGSDSPNPALPEFRGDQIRAIAGALSLTGSGLSKRYDGSYSSQRQELVEAEIACGRLCRWYYAQFARPIWRRWAALLVASGAWRLPQAAAPASLFAPMLRPGGGTPWIDPAKEVAADRERVEAGFASRRQVIRERGGDPDQVDRERATDRAPGESRRPAVAAVDETETETETEVA